MVTIARARLPDQSMYSPPECDAPDYEYIAEQLVDIANALRNDAYKLQTEPDYISRADKIMNEARELIGDPL